MSGLYAIGPYNPLEAILRGHDFGDSELNLD